MKRKKSLLKSVHRWSLAICCLLWLGNQTVTAQETLYGIEGMNFVSVDTTTGATTTILTFPATYSPVARLTFNPLDSNFYAIANNSGTTTCRLIKFKPCEDTVTLVGSMSLNSQPVVLCEAIDFNPNDSIMYAAVSNATAGPAVFASNNFVTVSPTTGVTTFISGIVQGNPATNNEADNFEFYNVTNGTSSLLLQDGFPASNVVRYYNLDYTNPGAGNAAFLQTYTTNGANPIWPTVMGYCADNNKVYFIDNIGNLRRMDTIIPSATIPISISAPISFVGTNILGLDWGMTCCPYEIPATSMTCDSLDCLCCGIPRICIPLNVKDTIQDGMIGIDFCMIYDSGSLTPTGNVEIGNVVLDGSPNANYAINYVMTPGELHVSIYYDPSAPSTAEFTGLGEIACVEFQLLSQYTTGDTLEFSVCEVIEGFQTSVEFECADNGSFILKNDTTLTAKVIYWQDHNRPLRYDDTNPLDYPVTDFSGTDDTCAVINPNVATPDINGYVTYNTNMGSSIQIMRDIAGSFGSTAPCPGPIGVMPVINGMDTYFTSLVTTLNGSYVPNVYQIIAMDVNMDGYVSANDITHIQNRTIGNICEFPQAWNYPAPVENSLDWRFVDSITLNTNPAYSLSTSFPGNDSVGYSRYNVPDVPFCLEVATDSNTYCSKIIDQTYSGILLGDANGTWNGNTPGGNLKVNTSMIYALDEATRNGNCELTIPVYYQSNDNLMAMDFALDYDESRLSLIGVTKNIPSASPMSMAFNNMNSESLLLTSYSTTPGGISTLEPVYFLTFASIDDQINDTDLGTISSYFNGVSTVSTVQGTNADCATAGSLSINELIASSTHIYPNPFADFLEVTVEGSDLSIATIELVDAQGRVVLTKEFNNSKTTTLNTEKIVAGLYLIRVNGVTTKKVMKH